jgi:hypothetical protein
MHAQKQPYLLGLLADAVSMSNHWPICSAEMQDAEQAGEQPRRLGNPSWTPGVSQNPAGRESKAQRRERIERIVETWAAPYGGAAVLSPAELDLALAAAELSLSKPRRHEDLTRRANTLARLLAAAGLASKREREPIEEEEPEPPARSAGDIIAERLDELQREREGAQ